MKKYVIGLTGGTGAGKSLVSKHFFEKGAHVIDADIISRETTKKGSKALIEIEERFPGVVIDGELNRKELGKIVFSDSVALSDLNKITHKYINAKIKEEIDKTAGLIILDAPLLFEAGANELCDTVIFVDAPEALRKERIMKRDNLTEEEADKRIKARDLIPIIKKCDFVLLNDGDIDALMEDADNVLALCYEKGAIF